MTASSKIKSCPKLVVDFESNLESVKSDNHTNNQQKCMGCLKPRSGKNEHECKKCGCHYFYVPNFESFLFVILSIL